MTVTKLEIAVFPGGFNLPMWIAVGRGFFADQGLEVELHYTGSSVDQIVGVIEARYDLVMTGFDNVVAYQEGQGAVPLSQTPDLFAFMGSDTAFLSVAVRPDITSYADLNGKTLAVDALTTGFAFVLRKMLALNGVDEKEVTFESAGGVMQRFERLKRGETAGTLVVTPFDELAERAGCVVLQRASAAIPNYQGVVGAARRSWAENNRDVLVKFIVAYRRALRWMFLPENRGELRELLAANVKTMDAGLIDVTLDRFLDATTGFERDANLNADGMATVLALRSEYGRPQKKLSDAYLYVDERYYKAAREKDAAAPT